MLTLLALLACGHHDSDTGYTDPPQDLYVPPLDGVDLEQATTDALKLAIAADLRPVWGAHAATLAMGEPGCPDLYWGTPDLEIDGIDMDANGLSWLDHCATSEDVAYDGYLYWESKVAADGDASSEVGQTIEGERAIVADGIVSQGDDVIFEVKGDGSDALTQETATGYSRTVYSSIVDATVTGSEPFPTGSATEGGYRTDMYLYWTQGDAETLEARGNLYLFDARLQDRFDSVSLDVEMTGPQGAAPDDCTAEPRGWIGVRDADAYWYDVVFEPRHDDDATDTDYPDDPYTSCDGCGTLYVRGLVQVDADGDPITVCPDLSFVWDTLAPPAPADFAMTVRDADGEGGR